MSTDTLLLILTGLCAFIAAALVWIVLEMRLLKIQTSESMRRDEQDEMIEAILRGAPRGSAGPSQRGAQLVSCAHGIDGLSHRAAKQKRGRSADAQRDGPAVVGRNA